MFALPRVLDADLIWIVAADYRQARPEFVYLLDALLELNFVRPGDYTLPKNEFQPCAMKTVTGCEIRTLTAADERKLASFAPEGIIAAEAAQLSYDIFLRLRGRLAEKRGWLLLEGTFENQSGDWYASLWNEWRDGKGEGGTAKSYSLPTWSNSAIFPLGESDPEIQALKRSMSASRFAERHGGVPVPPSTVVFPEFSYVKHVGTYPYTQGRPVSLAIDPGYAGAYSVLALQWDNAKVYVIDEVYLQGVGARGVIKECHGRPWWKDVVGGVIDIAGKTHPGMDSHVEIWAESPDRGGAGLLLRSRYIPIEDGIERLRTRLIDPVTGEALVLFNAETTTKTVREFNLYRYPEDKEGHGIREVPIDRDNHSIKALTYWLVNRYGFTGTKRKSHVRAKYGRPPVHKQTRHRRRRPKLIFG